MKLPRRLNDVLRKKEAFLEQVRDKLEKTALQLQVSLFEQIIEDIIPRLDVKNGILVDNAHNYRLISELNKIYDTFNIKIVETILPQINKGIETIVSVSDDFFI